MLARMIPLWVDALVVRTLSPESNVLLLAESVVLAVLLHTLSLSIALILPPPLSLKLL